MGCRGASRYLPAFGLWAGELGFCRPLPASASSGHPAASRPCPGISTSSRAPRRNGARFSSASPPEATAGLQGDYESGSKDPRWEFPKIGDPNIVPQLVGSFL